MLRAICQSAQFAKCVAQFRIWPKSDPNPNPNPNRDPNLTRIQT